MKKKNSLIWVIGFIILIIFLYNGAKKTSSAIPADAICYGQNIAGGSPPAECVRYFNQTYSNLTHINSINYTTFLGVTCVYGQGSTYLMMNIETLDYNSSIQALVWTPFSYDFGCDITRSNDTGSGARVCYLKRVGYTGGWEPLPFSGEVNINKDVMGIRIKQDIQCNQDINNGYGIYSMEGFADMIINSQVACVPDCSCAATTNVGSTCSNGCSGTCDGLFTPAPTTAPQSSGGGGGGSVATTTAQDEAVSTPVPEKSNTIYYVLGGIALIGVIYYFKKVKK